MADLSFIYNSDSGHSDISVSDGDFMLDDTLQTAVEISIFSDRRATEDEIRAVQSGVQERQSRRGYWANSFKDNSQGSGLWILNRSSKTAETLSDAKVYCDESLNWLISSGIAAAVSSSAEYSGDAIIIRVSITKPTGQEVGFRYQFAWDSLGV